MRRVLLCVVWVLTCCSLTAQAEDEGFELWSEPTAGSAPAQPARVLAAPAESDAPREAPQGDVDADALALLKAQVEAEAAQAARVEAGDYVIHFGVGESWLMSLRPDDLAHDDRWLTEISVRWAPFGLIGEIGFDFAIGQDRTLLLRPNLKFFFVKGGDFSLFLEGSCDVLVLADSTEVGGGGGLGFSVGLMDHLALEVLASASVFGLDDSTARQFVGGEPIAATAGGDRVVVFPGVSARLMARF
jgi:hypothetical protein